MKMKETSKKNHRARNLGDIA